MLKGTITQDRLERHKYAQEDFTPTSVINIMLSQLNDESLYSDFNKTFCDTSIGVGNIYIDVLKRRLQYCNSEEQIYSAISSMYGTELISDNVIECKENIIKEIMSFCMLKNIQTSKDKLYNILNKNIVCTDFFSWDFEKWEKIK